MCIFDSNYMYNCWSGSRFRNRKRSPSPRYSRSPCYVRSPPPRYARSPSGSCDYSPPPSRMQYSRWYSHERSYSGTPERDCSPSYDRLARSQSRSPREARSPPYDGLRNPICGPVRRTSSSRSRRRSVELGDYYVFFSIVLRY